MRKIRPYLGIIFSALGILAVTSIILFSSRNPDPIVGAPSTQLTYEKTLIPITDSLYDLGTSTQAWRNAYIDQICLSGDCQTAWPAGGGGSGTVSTSTNETAGRVPYWTTTSGTPAKLGEIATGTLAATSPLSVSASRFLLGGSATLSLDTSGAWSGTAGSLAANGANCSAGSFPLGVDTAGAAESCTDAWTEAENTAAGYATRSSFSATTPIMYNSSTGAFTWVGLATTSQPASSNLLVSNGLAGVYGVATSSATINSPLSGTLTVIGSGQSLSIANAAADGSTKGAASFTAADFDASSGNISIDYTNGQAASASAKGFLTSADWTTFNNKIGWGAATSTSANQFVYTNNLGLLVSAASSSLNLPNSALQNSSITVNSTAIALGGSGTITAASSTLLGDANTFSGALRFANATSTGTFYVTGDFASTTKLYADGLTDCGASNKLSWSAGKFTCAADQTGGGGTFPFSADTNYGQVVYSTSTPTLWLKSGLFASSTSHFVNSTTSLATILSTLWLGDPNTTPTTDSSATFNGDKNNSWILGNDLTDNSFAIASSTALGTTNYFTLSKSGGYKLNQLTSNGFVKTSGSDGTLSIDTTTYTAQTRALTVAGTANQITSSAGSQDLSADRTWTLSLPSHVIFPGNFQATRATTTHATSTNLDITGLLTFNGVTGSTWTAFCTTITGGAGLCDGDDATGAGGAFPFTSAIYGTQTVNSTSTGLWLTGSPLSLIASSTFATYASSTQLSVSGNTWLPSMTSALLLTDAAGLVAEYAGAGCTNQVVEDISALGASTCVSINNGYWSGTDLSVANGGTGLSTFGGTNTLLYTTAADTLSSEAALTYNPSLNLLTVEAASTTNLTVSSFFKAPTAASFATNMQGTFHFDTTSGNLLMGTTTSPSADHVVIASATTTLYAFSVASTSPDFVNGGIIDLPPHFLAQNAIAIMCHVDGGTSQQIFLSDGTNDTNTITCSTTDTQYALTANNNWTAYEAIRLEFVTKSGSPDYLVVRVLGYRTSN